MNSEKYLFKLLRPYIKLREGEQYTPNILGYGLTPMYDNIDEMHVSKIELHTILCMLQCKYLDKTYLKELICIHIDHFRDKYLQQKLQKINLQMYKYDTIKTFDKMIHTIFACANIFNEYTCISYDLQKIIEDNKEKISDAYNDLEVDNIRDEIIKKLIEYMKNKKIKLFTWESYKSNVINVISKYKYVQ